MLREHHSFFLPNLLYFTNGNTYLGSFLGLRFRVQPTLREHEEILTFTRAELEKCFAEWLAELVRSGRVTVNDATLSAPRE